MLPSALPHGRFDGFQAQKAVGIAREISRQLVRLIEQGHCVSTYSVSVLFKVYFHTVGDTMIQKQNSTHTIRIVGKISSANLHTNFKSGSHYLDLNFVFRLCTAHYDRFARVVVVLILYLAFVKRCTQMIARARVSHHLCRA